MACISEALRRLVVERAADACEYCLLPNALSFYLDEDEVAHVIALRRLL